MQHVKFRPCWNYFVKLSQVKFRNREIISQYTIWVTLLSDLLWNTNKTPGLWFTNIKDFPNCSFLLICLFERNSHIGRKLWFEEMFHISELLPNCFGEWTVMLSSTSSLWNDHCCCCYYYYYCYYYCCYFAAFHIGHIGHCLCSWERHVIQPKK